MIKLPVLRRVEAGSITDARKWIYQILYERRPHQGRTCDEAVPEILDLDRAKRRGRSGECAMTKKYEIIPPSRGGLPAARNEDRGVTVTPPRLNPGGIIESTLTRWDANRHSRTIGAVAARTRAETDLFDAQTQALASYGKRQEAAFRLRELPEILANDLARRRVDRAEELRKVQHQQLSWPARAA